MAFRIEAATCGLDTWVAQASACAQFCFTLGALDALTGARGTSVPRIWRASIIAFALVVGSASAQPFALAARHRHLHGAAAGTLTFTEAGLRFDESGKHESHSRSWEYKDIQVLELSPTEIHVRTYEDVRWQLGRDLAYTFDRIAAGETPKLYPFLSSHLDQRFIARLPEAMAAPFWQASAKLLHRTRGVNGDLKFGTDRIVFEGAGEHASRTWRYTDVQNLSSSGPFDLSLTSLDGETRFQLKHALPEDRYNDLWRRIMEANGLKGFQSQLESHHD
jgi:hypothetical protein